MPGRPLPSVPNIFASEGSGIPNNIPLLDADFASLCSFFSDSSIGYVNYGFDTGAANAYVVTLAAAPSAYIIGMTIALRVANTNTGPSNINVNSLGNVQIFNPAGIGLSGGELQASSVVILVYTSPGFIICGPCPLSARLTGLTSNASLTVYGYTSISLYLQYTGGPSTVTILNGLSTGVPIQIVVANNSGANLSFSLGINNSSGVTVPTINYVLSGQSLGAAFTNNVVLGNNTAKVIHGSLNAPLSATFSH